MDLGEFRVEMATKTKKIPSEIICTEVPNMVQEWDSLLQEYVYKIITPDGRKVSVDDYTWFND